MRTHMTGRFGRRGRLRTAIVAAAAAAALQLALVLPASAQTATAEGGAKAPFEVKLQPAGRGAAAFHERTATPEGDALVLRDLDMTRAVLIGVEPLQPGATLDVALYKVGVPEPLRRGAADASGTVLFAFRTYDEVGIEVKSAAAAGYRIALMTAPPVEPPMPSPFTAPADEASWARLPAWAWLAAALVLAAVAALWFRGRRRAQRVAGMLLAVGVAGWMAGVEAGAQSGPPTLRSPGAQPPPSSAQPGSGVDVSAPTQPAPTLKSPGAPAPGSTEGQSAPGSSPGGPAGPDEGWKQELKNLRDMRADIDKYGALVDKLYGLYSSLKKVEALSQQDLAFEPDYAPPGMPSVNSSCAAGQYSCRECFAPAYKNLSEVRRKLENNRIVLANYGRRMQAIDDAGRALGGMHGGLGIIYLQSKADWEQQRAQIAGIYDTRYRALLIELQTALRAIESCEAKVNNTRSWYDRFGFMYYEFMAARYRRTGGAF